MAVGFIVDNGDSGVSYPGRWQSGEPVFRRWLGLRQDRKAQLDVQTWRCSRCGFLESFAPAVP